MNEKLFKKVNKKRGLELENAMDEINNIVFKEKDYINFIFEIVKKILIRINFKDSLREFDCGNPTEGGYTFLFNEDDFLLLENTFEKIGGAFFSISTWLIFLRREKNLNYYNSARISLTMSILKIHHIVGKSFDKIVSIITKIEREEFRADIDYAIYLLKDVKTRCLKARKEIAILFVQD